MADLQAERLANCVLQQLAVNNYPENLDINGVYHSIVQPLIW